MPQTIIENASIEPEVIDLADFLCAMGARVHGAGTSTIQIEGTPRLHGAAGMSVLAHLEDLVAKGLVKVDGEVAIDSAFSPG